MEFDKIKLTDKVVTLDYTIRDAHGSAATTFTSSDAPLPTFKESLMAFVPFVMHLLDLPEHWKEDLVITGLSIDREEETKCRGLIVTARRRIGKANGRPVIINTPRMPEANDNTSANIATLLDEEIEFLETAEAEATKFLNGDRDSQPELADDDDEEEELITSDREPDPMAGKADPPKRRRGRPRKGKDFIPGVGDVANPDKTVRPTDKALHGLLYNVGYDVPVDAIVRWTSTERDAAQRFADAAIAVSSDNTATLPDVPECVKRDAVKEFDGDGWTSPDRPPKAEEVEPVHG